MSRYRGIFLYESKRNNASWNFKLPVKSFYLKFRFFKYSD